MEVFYIILGLICCISAADCFSLIKQNEGKKNVETLDDNGKVLLSWEVDITSGIITFEIEAETTGYIGFGISPQGSMEGADIFIAGVYPDGTSYHSDRFGTGFVEPKVDAHADWDLLEAKELLSNRTYLKFSRLLNTCDDEDYPITEDTNRLIWALGATDAIAYHSTDRRGSRSVNLLGAPMPEMDLETMKEWEMTLDMEMPSDATAYWCSFHKGPVLTTKHQIVAFDALLPDTNALKHTHHFIVYNCYNSPGSNQTMDEIFQNFTVDKYPGDLCYRLFSEDEVVPPMPYCQEYLYVWAKGGKKMVFPENVGYPIGEGESGESQYYMLEIHYDNPDQVSGVQFDAGLKVFYTDQLRTIDAGLLTVGQGVSQALTVPPNTPEFVTVGHCSSDCTAQFPQDGINVFNSLLHSHLSGRKLKARHFRGGEELPWLDFDDHYDFDYQQNKHLAKEIKVLPGDHLIYECTYDSTWKNGSVVTGDLSTQDEMCQAFLWYYPKWNIDVCGSNYPLMKAMGEFGIENFTFVQGVGNPKIQIISPESLRGDYEESMSFKFNWTPAFIQELETTRRFGVHDSVCFGYKEGEGESGEVQYPKDFEPYIPRDVCVNGSYKTNFSFLIGLIGLVVSMMVRLLG